MLTILVYLMDTEEGGATEFGHLGITVASKAGRGVMWNNVAAGTTFENEEATHEGRKVIKGRKMVLNYWVNLFQIDHLCLRARPTYYSHTRPDDLRSRLGFHP